MYVTSDEAEAELWLQEYYLNQVAYLLMLKNLPPIHQNGELDFY